MCIKQITQHPAQDHIFIQSEPLVCPDRDLDHFWSTQAPDWFHLWFPNFFFSHATSHLFIQVIHVLTLVSIFTITWKLVGHLFFFPPTIWNLWCHIKKWQRNYNKQWGQEATWRKEGNVLMQLTYPTTSDAGEILSDPKSMLDCV